MNTYISQMEQELCLKYNCKNIDEVLVIQMHILKEMECKKNERKSEEICL